MPPIRHRGNRSARAGIIEVLDISSSSSYNASRSSSSSGSAPIPDGETSCEFATTFPTETKNITWRVKDFTTIMQLKGVDGKHQVKFSAGDSVDMPSKWKLELLGDEEKVGLFLSMVHYGGPATKVYARFDSCIKYPCGTKDVVTRSVQPTDMKAVEDWGWSSFTTVAQLKATGALGSDDSITIQIKFILYGKKGVNTLSAEGATATLERNAKDLALEQFGDLLQSGRNSDFVIKVPVSDCSVEYASVKVHKAILGARSPVFQAMFESDMMETRTGETKIEDLSLKSLNVLLKFMYTGVVDDEWKKIPEEIVNAANKYSLPSLREHCDKKLHSTCTPGNALKLLKVAKMHQLPSATANIGNYIKSNVDGIVDNV